VSAVLSVVSVGGLCGADFPSIDRLPAQPDLPDPLVMFNGERVTTANSGNETAARAEGTLPALHAGYLPRR
jgi:hypothetical protein